MDDMQDKTKLPSMSAPPPPSEVNIRTMRSDLESMAKSGGGAPKFQSVEVSGLSVEREYSTNAKSTSAAGGKKETGPILIVIVVALLALAGVGYFAYITLFSAPAASTQGSEANASSSSPSATPPSPSPSTGSTAMNVPLELSLAHTSLFTKPADQKITVSFIQSYQKDMNQSLAAANVGAALIEIIPKAADSNAMSLAGILAEANVPILNSSALSNVLNPDATMFVYRDKNGFWPGLVVTTVSGQSSSSVAATVQQLEASSNIGNLFLTSMGSPSSGGFTGGSIAGVPVRMITFGGSYTPSTFVYGWIGNDLILSTSQNGFAAAAARL